MTAGVVLDVVIACLLAATIVFCVVLNRRISALKKAGGEMTALLSGFNKSVSRAHESVVALREAAEEAGVGLQQRIEQARAVRDELAFLTDAGRKSAGGDRSPGMEQPLDRSPPASRGEGSDESGAPQPVVRSEAERELLHALRRVR
jgi:hypothetical protein